MDTLLDLCVSSLRRGHANLLCIVPILTDDPRRESKNAMSLANAIQIQENLVALLPLGLPGRPIEAGLPASAAGSGLHSKSNCHLLPA